MAVRASLLRLPSLSSVRQRGTPPLHAASPHASPPLTELALARFEVTTPGPFCAFFRENLPDRLMADFMRLTALPSTQSSRFPSCDCRWCGWHSPAQTWIGIGWCARRSSTTFRTGSASSHAEDVEERQHAHERRQVGDLEGIDLLQVRHEVAMRQHHTLGAPVVPDEYGRTAMSTAWSIATRGGSASRLPPQPCQGLVTREGCRSDGAPCPEEAAALGGMWRLSLACWWQNCRCRRRWDTRRMTRRSPRRCLIIWLRSPRPSIPMAADVHGRDLHPGPRSTSNWGVTSSKSRVFAKLNGMHRTAWRQVTRRCPRPRQRRTPCGPRALRCGC